MNGTPPVRPDVRGEDKGNLSRAPRFCLNASLRRCACAKQRRGLLNARCAVNDFRMNETRELSEAEKRQRRVELARKAFKDFFAQCFWSADPNYVIEEKYLPWVMANLRYYGGHRGYRIVAELCR